MSFWSWLAGTTTPFEPTATYTPGDPNGAEFEGEETFSRSGLPFPVPSPWSGWPSEWATPAWNTHLGLSKLIDSAWGCIDLNASVLAAMPPYRLRNGDIIDPPSWLQNPDPLIYTSWYEFAKQLFWDFQMGEAFVLPMSFGADGYPLTFRTIPPWLINVELRGGRRVYNLGSQDVTGEILHLRYQSATDDAHGHGPLEVAGARMTTAGVLGKYATRLAETGGTPAYWLGVDRRVTKAEADDLLSQWVESRVKNLGYPALLSGGVTLNQLQSMNAKDMALLELAQFSESRIAVLLGVPPFLAGLPSGGDSMTYCLSDDTEILTRRGWLTCDQVTTDDIALTLDHELGVSVWQPIEEVSIFDVVDEPMLKMESRSHSSLSTLAHRWPIISRSSGTRRWVDSEHFGQEHNVLLAAPCADLSDEAKYSDDFVALVAWFTTEGYLNRDYSRTFSTIAQSSVRNPGNTAAIRATLTRIFGPARVKGQRDLKYVKLFGDDAAWVEDLNRVNGMVSFRLNHEATSLLVEVTEGDPEGKAISYDFLMSLTLAQLHLFIDTCIAGDGSTASGRGDQRVFIQNAGPRVDRFRFACTLAGIATSIYPRTGSDCVTVGVKKRTTYNPTFHNATPPERVTWSGRVWCPTTSNGTWFARRDGREFFTGNTNVSQLFDFHDRASLRPKATAVMSALSNWALPRGQSIELNRDEYSRPDFAARANAWKVLLEAGVVDGEFVRKAERFTGAASPGALTGINTPVPQPTPSGAPQPQEAT